MVSFSLFRLIALCSALASLANAAVTPSVPRLQGDVHPFNHGGLNPQPARPATDVTSRDMHSSLLDDPNVKLDKTARDILARATPSPPHWVIYGDKFISGVTGPPAASAITGYNVFALAFLLTAGAFDKAAEWTQLTASQRASVKSQYAAAGIKLVVSAFGATDAPTSTGKDPVAVANSMANFVKQFSLDGIDVDYEDFNAFNVGGGTAENWLIAYTRQLRTQLPQGTFILTHAPVAPWFAPGGRWPGGGYLKVHQNVGDLIDWYNVQFYNQGTNEYTNCSGLLDLSTTMWPQTAVFQIAANGVPMDKIVIGKPATTADASNGFMNTTTLSSCVAQASQRGWKGGVMVWQHPNAGAAWIKAVRSGSFPV